MTPLARLVRTRRKALGLTTERLGIAVRTTRSMVEQVERGFAMPKVDNALRWCEALDVTADAFLRAAARSVRVR
jgi:transcriptional regulator with XRE-family HTH domain